MYSTYDRRWGRVYMYMYTSISYFAHFVVCQQYMTANLRLWLSWTNHENAIRSIKWCKYARLHFSVSYAQFSALQIYTFCIRNGLVLMLLLSRLLLQKSWSSQRLSYIANPMQWIQGVWIWMAEMANVAISSLSTNLLLFIILYHTVLPMLSFLLSSCVMCICTSFIRFHSIFTFSFFVFPSACSRVHVLLFLLI